jgi:hypothetical protein
MIIGLSGYARSGKDTVAGMLIGLHKYDNRSFADPMREALRVLNPLVKDGGYRLRLAVDDYGWDSAKTAFPEIRRLLQVVGTEVGREMFGEDFWIKQALSDVNIEDKVVFTDVRFPNEALAIKNMYGEVWRISRPGVVALNDHASENSLDDWDFDHYIFNDSDMENLKVQIREGLL